MRLKQGPEAGLRQQLNSQLLQKLNLRGHLNAEVSIVNSAQVHAGGSGNRTDPQGARATGCEFPFACESRSMISIPGPRADLKVSATMRRVILVRHGESELNARQRQESAFCGQLETPLTDHGRRQALEIGKQLAAPGRYNIEYAVSSALGRAKETLELILSRLRTPPAILPAMAAFNERSLGVFEGRTESDVFSEYPHYRDDPSLNRFRADYKQKAPGGESLAEVTVRASRGFTECLQQSSGTLLIVSHCQTIRCLLAEKLRIEMQEALKIPIPHAMAILLIQSPDHEWRRELWGQ